MELNLEGRSALITGGSKGIGLAIAKGLAAEGCNLHLAARTEADLEAAKADISGRYNISVQTHALDLSNDAAREKLAEDVGELDILINNAGAIPGGGITDLTDEVWRDAWDLKLFGYIHMSRMIFPKMQARGAGVIVNIAGIAGRQPMPGYIAGATGNAALINFSRTLGVAGAKDGVRVVCINPGPTLTERLIYLQKLAAEKEFGDPERYRELPSPSIMGRPAEPEEVADLVVFFASERASYMSGTVID
ncbi:MAG: SDR family NAD(P)-dependent oxidoreductase, partial [Rhodospirillales bacterium]|nr:SDR family NAD(P)-dependent oxidoreductase [Rhodospirillales bacterium]